MTQVLIVCMGNICRSPMAKIVANKLLDVRGSALKFDSAGTHAQHIGERPDNRAKAALEKRGYAMDKSRSRRIIDKDFVRFDWILAMDRGNLAALKSICPPEHVHKLRLFLEGAGLDTDEVPDPYYGNAAGFERVLDLCEAGARSLSKSLG